MAGGRDEPSLMFCRYWARQRNSFKLEGRFGGGRAPDPSTVRSINCSRDVVDHFDVQAPATEVTAINLTP
ncbi:MAG: hypothetical protein ACYC1D_10860 [Acidimicrobiales bacterium]